MTMDAITTTVPTTVGTMIPVLITTTAITAPIGTADTPALRGVIVETGVIGSP